MEKCPCITKISQDLAGQSKPTTSHVMLWPRDELEPGPRTCVFEMPALLIGELSLLRDLAPAGKSPTDGSALQHNGNFGPLFLSFKVCASTSHSWKERIPKEKELRAKSVIHGKLQASQQELGMGY